MLLANDTSHTISPCASCGLFVASSECEGEDVGRRAGRGWDAMLAVPVMFAPH